MTYKFENKITIITGSSRGIGKTTAIEMAEKGAKIVINGRNESRLMKTLKQIKSITPHVIAYKGDVADPLVAKGMVNKTIETFGRLDILINNVGVSMRGNFEDVDPSVFGRVFSTNVLGVVNPTIPAMPYIKESKGSIIFISSLAGIRGLPYLSAYCASKMALRAIAESIRIEEVNSDIHVGLVYVGVTEVEDGKTSIMANGNLGSLPDRSAYKVQSMRSVALSILKNIRKRRFITTLTGIGKLNAFLQSILPGLVEKILILYNKRGLLHEGKEGAYNQYTIRQYSSTG